MLFFWKTYNPNGRLVSFALIGAQCPAVEHSGVNAAVEQSCQHWSAPLLDTQVN